MNIRWMNELNNEIMIALKMDEWMDGWLMDAGMNKWTDGRMHQWMNE